MAKIEVIKQRDLKDCGPCSLACIIKYYDGYVPIEKIREDTLTSINGTTAYHLITAAKSYGFDASGVKVDNILDERIYLPAIVHLNLQNGLQHFVVIYKISKEYVWIMDPARGKVKLRIDEFNYLWSKVILLFTPINNILCFKHDITIFKLFKDLLCQNKCLFGIVILINIFLMFFSIVSNFYFQVVASGITSGFDTKLLKVIIIIFLLVFLLKVVINFLKNYYLNYFNKNIDVLLFSSFLKHIFNLPLRFIQNRTVGEIISRVDELSEIKNLLSEVFTSVILNSILALGAIVVLYFINTKLFFILCLIICIYGIIGLILSKLIYHHIKENIESSTEFNTTLVENIEMNTSIKNLNLEDQFYAKLENKLILLLKNNFNLQKLSDSGLFLKEFIYELGIFTILTMGFYMIFKGNLTILELITFNSLIIYLFGPIKEIIDLIPKYDYLKVSFNKISEFLNINEEDYNTGLNSNIKDITLTNVNYSYNKYSNILENLNLQINFGDKVFLSGPSGCGKSTICKLIFGLLNNYDGKITLNDTSEKDINLKSIRANILYIGQEENLFTGTIKDNILCSRSLKSEELKKILDICRIESILEKRPNRLETLVNASLNNLSGGEKQRIILARGLLKKSNIIILDEALSEVDIKLEKDIITDLLAYFKNQTIIYVSHKDVSDKFTKIIRVGNNA